jgi:hypothetical protein
VEIENKYQISSLEDDHLIFLMFPWNILVLRCHEL